METLRATRQHPFFVEGKGFVPAGGLAVGNAIVTRAGPTLKVKSLKWHRRAEGWTVYNFEVESHDTQGEDTHNYFVGKRSGGVWVHNGDCLKINPREIKFGQKSVSWNFSDGNNIGDTALALRNGTLQDLPPIKVVRTPGGNLVTLDNRRLLTYRSANKEIPYTIVDPTDPAIAREMARKLDFPEGIESPYIRNVHK